MDAKYERIRELARHCNRDHARFYRVTTDSVEVKKMIDAARKALSSYQVFLDEMDEIERDNGDY
jgi:hypothetical protein